MHEKNEKIATADLVQDLIKEKKADRRWRNIRFLIGALLVFYISAHSFKLFHTNMSDSFASTKYTALIRLDGMIAPGRNFSGEELIPVLQEAFSDKKASGVILDINSPGGTPVQAAIIHDQILFLKRKYHKKVIVIGEDLLTSGAYYVAVAGDKIYVNPNTLTGSIGVIMKGFGFVDLMKKLGIERRVYTAGNDKDRLDPFLPQSPNDLKKIQHVISEVHQNFVNAVLTGRKGKLKGNVDALFSGDFWSGEEALKLGLVDGLGNLTEVLNTEFSTTHYREYNTTPNLFKTLSGQLGSTFDKWVYLN